MPETDKTTEDGSLVMSFKIHKQTRRGRTILRDGEKSMENAVAPSDISSGRIPRISRLMALSIHLQSLVDHGEVQDYADIARLTGVTRARVTQIMNLTLLSPEIQWKILALKPTLKGDDQINERMIRYVYQSPFWNEQMKTWKDIFRT